MGSLTIRANARALAMLILLALSGCHVPDSVIVHVTRQQIQDQVAGRFPIEKRELLYKATFSEPVVQLASGGNQVGVDAKARLEFTPDAAVDGRVSLVGTLEYDPTAGALYVRRISVADTHIDAVPAAISPLLRGIGGIGTVDRLFRDVCKAVPPRVADVKVGQLPDDWTGRAAKTTIRSIRTSGDGVDVEVGIPR